MPSYCTLGACAFCGVGEAIGWTESSLEWRDGSPAPLCGPCNQIFEMRGEPTDEYDMRVVALEAFTGYAELCGPTMGMRAFFELAADGERGVGYTEPWTYRPEALAEVRRQAWESRPELAPADEAQRIISRQMAELQASRERAAELATIEGAGISWAAPEHDVG